MQPGNPLDDSRLGGIQGKGQVLYVDNTTQAGSADSPGALLVKAMAGLINDPAHKGEAINRSRERIFLAHSSLHYMAAALPADNLLGMKIYTVTRSAWRR